MSYTVVQRHETVDNYQQSRGPAPASFNHESHRAASGWPTAAVVVKVSVISGCGIISGFAYEKAKVYSPMIIRDQMDLSRFVMLKLFLSAVATGLVWFSVFSILPMTKRIFSTARQSYDAPLANKGLLSVMLGGGLVGMGLTLSGTCPGMVFTQIGGGVTNAIYTMIGGFAGVLVYGAVSPYIHKPYDQPSKHTWLDRYKSMSFASVALPMAFCLAGVIAVVEYAIPWTTEVLATDTGNLLTDISWSPIMSGVIIGSMQVPLMLAVNDTLGSSSSYRVLLSRMLPLVKKWDYFRGIKYDLDNWWQVIYLGSIAVAALASASLSSSYASERGVLPAEAFAGGVLLLYGSRLASGCTSGHGLSGMALLNLKSFAGIAAIFAGAMTLQLVRNLL